MVPPPPLNPVWMTAVPAFGRATPRTFEGAFTTNDIFTLYSFFTRLQAQGNPSSTLAAQSDPVAKYIFDHLSGDWPAAPPVDGEEPAAPDTTTKAMLALWGTGWLIYNQPPNYIPDDGVLLAKIVADMNTALALSGPGTPPNAADNPLAAAYNILLPGGTAVDGYTPSTRTRTLLTQLQLTPGQAKPRLLNRSIMQDAFMEIRRWYDPAITYVHLVCGDGFAKMGDGTELYTFGFSDQTEVANNPTDNPDKGPDKVLAFAHSAATISAPTIVLEQDQEFHLDLSNVGFDYRPDLFDPHTVHFHGFPQAAPIFDGMPMASVSVLEGATLPYFYRLNIEGTYFYHCHVEATEHMQQGMIGNLYVHSRQDKIAAGTPLAHLPPGKGPAHRTSYRYVYNDGDGSTEYDVEYPMQITGFDHHFHDEEIGIQPPAFATLFDTYPLLNGRGYPDTVKTGSIQNSLGINAQQVSSKVTARRGQRVLLRISNVSETDFNTLTVLGIPMTIVGKDARLLRGPDGKNLYYRTTSVTLGGGETADAILDTAGLPIGTYFIYAARLTQLSNDEEDYGGVMTEIQITQ
ncbi:MAG TPA: hypothetical protein DCM86_13880 [Verrucomicrobiales bacterium]|nr:hypothetical protein [Verrucomicrobiales bacterium]